MRRKAFFRYFTVPSVILMMLASCDSKHIGDPTADIEAINALWTDYEATLEANDVDAWLSLWTDDGIQMPPNEPLVIGKDRIRLRNAAALKTFSIEMDITNQEVEIMRDFAFSRGVYTATLTPYDGGNAIPVDGKFMTILKRGQDGSWKIHRDIFNSNSL